MRHFVSMSRLNSEERIFFPVEIFSSPNTVFDSVSDAKSLDIKF